MSGVKGLYMYRLPTLLILLFVFVQPGSSIAEISGEDIFNLKCAVCHGTKGSGTDKGPPLVHKVYRPGHHGDYSFHLAVNIGVRQHHWPFGDMAPVKGVKREEVDAIILYIRGLQREAGII